MVYGLSMKFYGLVKASREIFHKWPNFIAGVVKSADDF